MGGSMKKDEFIKTYCDFCGTQRCEGIDTEWFTGCPHRNELEDSSEELKMENENNKMNKVKNPFAEAFFIACDPIMSDYFLDKISFEEAVSKASLSFEEIINSSDFQHKINSYFSDFDSYNDI